MQPGALQGRMGDIDEPVNERDAHGRFTGRYRLKSCESSCALRGRGVRTPRYR